MVKKQMELVLFNNYLFEYKISTYLTDFELKNFSETCNSARKISKYSLVDRKHKFFNSEYLKKFRVLHTSLVNKEENSVILDNFLVLCDFFISKEYITLIFFRERPGFFQSIMTLLDEATYKLDYYPPGILLKVRDYSDKIQRIYANIPWNIPWNIPQNN